MKSRLFFTILIFFLFNSVLFAAGEESRGESEDDPNHWATIDEICESQKVFGLYQSFGVSWACVTRLQERSDASNFVWKDKMIGAYVELQSHDLKNFSKFWSLNFMGRMAIYYPYKHTFREVPQLSKQVLVYSFDWFLAPVFRFNFFDYLGVEIEPGVHLMYQLHDMWHYWNMGIGAKVDIEMPISSRWTAILGGMFSWDNANLGKNKIGRKFDHAWEYQAQLGFRYNKKYLNPRSYIKYKPKRPKTKHGKIKPLTQEIKEMMKETFDEDLDENETE